MDVDGEIVSDDGDCPNPLFDSIMNAMNSMKEATADKIYQKIQREGENSYSKPQVDRALASALRYGIFEKRNNRYRVRDDILDDEDTVYWKFNKNRMQTPFRLQENYDDSQNRAKLDPEKDNKRFVNLKKKNKCLRCGRIKRPSFNAYYTSFSDKKYAEFDKKFSFTEKEIKKVNENMEKKKKQTKTVSKKKGKKKLKRKMKLQVLKKKEMQKKKKCQPATLEKGIKNLTNGTTATLWAMNYQHLRSSSFDRSLNDLEAGKSKVLLNKATYDSSDSEVDTLSSPTDEQSFKSYPHEGDMKFRDPYKEPRSVLSSEYDYLEDCGYNMPKKTRPNDSLKSDTVTEKSELSSATNRTMTPSLTGLNIPSTSKNLNEKEINQYITTGGELYGNKSEGKKAAKCDEKREWMGYSDEPRTAVIQTKNVLTIEPMDSLTLKSPDYIS